MISLHVPKSLITAFLSFALAFASVLAGADVESTFKPIGGTRKENSFGKRRRDLDTNMLPSSTNRTGFGFCEQS